MIECAILVITLILPAGIIQFSGYMKQLHNKTNTRGAF